MLIKLLGGLLVIGTCTAMGNLVASNITRRPRQLVGLQEALAFLETEIDYGTPLPEALARVASLAAGPARRIAGLAAESLSGGDGVSAGKAWESAVGAVFPESALREQDREALLVLGPFLGLSHRQDQLRHIRGTLDRLKALEKVARGEEERHLRLVRYLGFLGGLVVVLVLI